MIGGIFPIEPSAAYVEGITKNYRIQHQVKEIDKMGFGNVHIDHAFLITSNSSPAVVTAQPIAA